MDDGGFSAVRRLVTDGLVLRLHGRGGHPFITGVEIDQAHPLRDAADRADIGHGHADHLALRRDQHERIALLNRMGDHNGAVPIRGEQQNKVTKQNKVGYLTEQNKVTGY